MASLSEKDLLLLSNYLYLDKCTQYSTINEMLDSCRSANGWINENKAGQLGVGGGMTKTECRKLLQEMDNASDELKNLRVARTIDEPELRAICFEHPGDDGTATVVFRGTGGAYRAWADNVQGQYKADTDIQKMADDFVRYNCGVYDNITVTGHSKGGNLAGYTAITNRDRVRACLAFDPQGYGSECLKAHKDEMKDASYNIKVVSTDNDPVNTLLVQVARDRVFVKNERKGLIGRHGSYALLEACEFDSDGNITNAVSDRDLSMDLMHRAVLSTTALLGMLPKGGNEKATNVLASLVASIMSDDMGADYERSEIKKSLADLGHYGFEVMGRTPRNNMSIKPVTDSLYADTVGIKSAAVLMDDMKKELTKVTERIGAVRTGISYRASSRLVVEGKLKLLEERLTTEVGRLASYSSTLENIACQIESCENDIVSLIGGTGTSSTP
ncbi:MAG: DUF2974 domain-containing protein [Lachnospiraceae bacterium]|nr:DUF2974 domain-containing protein [Lachnospiraceae bacterium]